MADERYMSDTWFLVCVWPTSTVSSTCVLFLFVVYSSTFSSELCVLLVLSCMPFALLRSHLQAMTSKMRGVLAQAHKMLSPIGTRPQNESENAS